jgi:isoleucyl-tRNA synthetase
LAPILAFTADEALAYFQGNQDHAKNISIHLMDWTQTSEIENFAEEGEIDMLGAL